MAARGGPVAIPAPFGGMNTRDGLAALKPHEARYLKNWTPVGSAVEPRKGHAHFSMDGPAATVETLAAFTGPAGSALIGIGDGDVYDFSSAMAVKLADADYTESRFQTECYGG